MDSTTMDLDEVLPGQIRTYEPPRLFEFVWGNRDGEADVLRFELEPHDGGARLVFTTWPGEPGPLGHAGTAAGWHACLDALQSLLGHGTAEEPDHGSVLELQEDYAALMAEV